MQEHLDIELTIDADPALVLEIEPATVDVGDLFIGELVPYIPSNYGLITWDGHVLTVS